MPRFKVFSRLTCPSTGPFDQGSSRAAATSAYVCWMPWAKLIRSSRLLAHAASSQLSNPARRCSRIMLPNSCASVCATARSALASNRRSTCFCCVAVRSAAGRTSNQAACRADRRRGCGAGGASRARGGASSAASWDVGNTGSRLPRPRRPTRNVLTY